MRDFRMSWWTLRRAIFLRWHSLPRRRESASRRSAKCGPGRSQISWSASRRLCRDSQSLEGERTMAESIKDLNRLLLERTLLDQPKDNDTLVLDDATLVAALEGARSLTRSQWNALLDSPLTLRRFRVLSNARHA